jgi:hypothetical protein
VKVTIADEGTGLPAASFSFNFGASNMYTIGETGFVSASKVPVGAGRTVSLNSITPADYRLMSAVCTSDGSSAVTGSSPAPGSFAPTGSVTFHMATDDELNCVFTLTSNRVFCVLPVYHDQLWCECFL